MVSSLVRENRRPGPVRGEPGECSLYRDDVLSWSARMYRLKAKGVEAMITDDIKQVVKTRYGRFAEAGGNPESC